MSDGIRVKPIVRRTHRASSGTHHPRNLTSRAALDRYAAHPGVERIWEDGDGIWADLKDGWVGEDGVTSVHGCPDEDKESALEDFIEQFRMVEKP